MEPGEEVSDIEDDQTGQMESARGLKINREKDFVRGSMRSRSFENYFGDTDTDTENSSLPHTRRWVWYCKNPACPKYYAAWTCKSNFILHLYETPIHREDVTTHARDSRRQLVRASREETAFDLSEPKKRPPPQGRNREE